jgi:hypothetical protein
MTDAHRSIEHYADEILRMISDDFDAYPALRTARSFADLHDHVDANEYMISALVPYEPDDQEVMQFYVAVQDEVTRRLQAVETKPHVHVADGPADFDGMSPYDMLTDVRTVAAGQLLRVLADSETQALYVWLCTVPTDECEFFDATSQLDINMNRRA